MVLFQGVKRAKRTKISHGVTVDFFAQSLNHPASRLDLRRKSAVSLMLYQRTRRKYRNIQAAL